MPRKPGPPACSFVEIIRDNVYAGVAIKKKDRDRYVDVFSYAIKLYWHGRKPVQVMSAHIFFETDAFVLIGRNLYPINNLSDSYIGVGKVFFYRLEYLVSGLSVSHVRSIN